MDEVVALEVTVDRVYVSGLAYMRKDSQPFIRERSGKVHEAHAVDYHPMLTQLDSCNFMHENGRGFRSLEEASRYVDAITKVDTLLRIATEVTNERLIRADRKRANQIVSDLQRDIKCNYLDVLSTVPAFQKMPDLLNQYAQDLPCYVINCLSK